MSRPATFARLTRTATALCALASLAAGCASGTRWTNSAGQAVIIYEAPRAADAESAKAILEARGWKATTAVAGVATRTRSSLAIYGQKARPGRGLDLSDALRPAVGDLDVLPFLQEGPGGNDAVLWIH
ncbi:MAG: hypothetical protein K8T90_04735 [Planctomycetes bacterium]|nr:hypothetical protein [Planctomycetota bacterium]